jgi:hypothetical protein
MYKHRIAGGSLGLGNPSSYGIQLPTWNAFWQITFGPYRGIFLLCPILLLFFVGALFMWQRHEMRRELLLCVAVVVIYFLVDASRPADVNGWSGGASVASRHLVPMLPFMVFPVAFTLGSPFWRRAFVLLGGLSTVMMTVISISPEVRGFSLFDGNPLVNELWYDVSRGRLEVNWGQMLGVTGPVTLLPLFLILSLLVVRLVWVYRRVTPAGTVMRETAVPVAAT